jgi:hypothetical protein
MKRTVALLATAVVSLALVARAGGPLSVTGTASTQPGQFFVWNTAAGSIPYTVDGGPMSKSPTGNVVVDHTAGVALLQSMFQIWQSVPTANISFQNAGPITASGLSSDGDVDTIAEYNAVTGLCDSGSQSPVVFDSNGSLFQSLGMDPSIIAFAGPCKLDKADGLILTGSVTLNGKFLDGVSFPGFASQNFDEAIAHEIGHFIGLDHSQINVEVLNQPAGSCNLDDLAGLPLMFPEELCQSRQSAGLPLLSQDDVAWISYLYPGAIFNSSYGFIRGTIYFSDGLTPVEGINVIARKVDDPNTPQDESKAFAVSVVSGFRFTGNPGQSVTGDNNTGSSFGSRDPGLIGTYEIPVPPGSYTVQVEAIHSSFTGSSGLGPLDPPSPIPGQPEFWHQYESANDDVNQKDPISVAAGQSVAGVDIILNGTAPRNDQFEDGSLTFGQRLFFWASTISGIARACWSV